MKRMKKQGKRILSVALSVLMLLTAWVFVAPEKANAAAEKWDGTIPSSAPSGFTQDGSSVTISSAAGFIYFLNSVNTQSQTYESKTINLTKDIDLNSIDFGNNVWPYDPTSRYFKGTFDGQNHTIYNFKMTHNNHRVAMFRQAQYATFKNINFENVDVNTSGNKNGYAVLVGYGNGWLTFENVHIKSGSVTGYNYVGGFIGEHNSGLVTISNCSNAATIVGRNDRIGGLVGSTVAQVKANDCENHGNVSGPKSVGGIIGYGDDDAHEISYCSNAGRIEATSEAAAGFIGYFTGAVTFSHCNNSGAVVAKQNAGGIAGKGEGNALTFEDCINTGNITATDYFAAGMLAEGNKENRFIRCANFGTITSTNNDAGGLVGNNDYHTLFEKCFNAGNVNAASGKSAGGMVGLTKYCSGSSSSNTQIVDCYNWGSISGGSVGGIVGYVGGVIGVGSDYWIEKVYNAGSLSGSNKKDQFYGQGGQLGSNCYQTSDSGTVSTYISSTDLKAFSGPSSNFCQNTWGVKIGTATYYYPILTWYRDMFTFESNFVDGETSTDTTILKPYGESFAAPNPTRVSHTSGAWFSTTDNTKTIAKGASVAVGVSAPTDALVVTQSFSDPTEVKNSTTYNLTWTINSYPVTFNPTADGGYTYTAPAATVDHGGSVSFTITPDAAHSQHLPTVSATVGTVDTPTEANGQYTYTVSGIDAPTTISVGAADVNTYTVTFNPAADGGYTYTAPAATVNHGSDVSFTVTLDSAHSESTVPSCSATNAGTVTSSQSGNVITYTVPNVTGDTTITLGAATLNSYTVTVTQGTGTTISGVATAADVAYGTTYTVSVSANTGYDQSTPKLYVNDVETESGTEITITEDTVIRSDALNLNTYNVTVTQGTGTTISGVATAADVAYGTTYTVSVSANTGYDQSTPKLYVNDVETESGTEITITEDTVIRSDSLNLNTYDVTVTQGTGTTISGVATAADVAYGTTYTVSVSANTGYDLSTPKLYVNDVETASGTEITITEDTVIRSDSLNLNTYSVTVNEGTGTTISGVSTAADVAYGTKYTVSVSANTGYDSSTPKLYVNDVETESGTEITITEDTVIRSDALNLNTYNVTVTEGTGTTISGVSTAADVAYGTIYTVSVSANTGYDQSTPKLYVNDVETESGTEITITEDTVIRSDSLNLNTYSVTVNEGTGTTITGVSTAANVAYGTKYTVSVSANTGYDSSTPKLYVNDVETESGTEITITEDTVIRSDALNLNTYNVTVTQGSGTTISGVSTAADVAYGTTYTVSVSANTGYDQSTPKLYVNDVETESGTEITITENTVIRSDALNLNSYAVTVTPGTGVGISGVETKNYEHGSAVTVTAAAEEGYNDASLKVYVNGEEITNGATITVTGTTAITTSDLSKLTYTVRFFDLDEQLIGEPQTVEYGAAATAPTLPTKADDDAAHGYTVTWDKAFDNVMSALDVYAQADAGTAHTWDAAGTVKAVVYNWTEDHSSCTATISCTDCAVQKTETADQISSNDDPVSTCSTHGTRTFTATFALEGLAPGTATAELPFDYNNHSTTETRTENYAAPGYTHKGYSGDKYCLACDHPVEEGQDIAKLNIADNPTVISANAILSEEQANPGTYDAAAVSALQTALSELETLVNGDDEQAVLDKLSEIGSKVEALNPLAYVTVIFTVDGNEVARQTIQSGMDATPPTMDAYSFTAGEATHKHFTGWVGSYTAVTEDVTITASYTDQEHTWVDGQVTLAATCMATGTQNQTCVCGATNVKTLEKDPENHTGNNHTETADEVAATCTAGGSYTEKVVCECGVTISSTPKTTPSLGHDFGDYVSDENATCEEDGTETAHCSRCEETRTRTVANSKLGHDWGEWVVTKEASCTETGRKTRTCSRDSSHTETEVLPKLSHADANGDGVCDLCGAQMSEHRHKDSNHDNTCDDCGQTIDTGFRCSMCNRYEEVQAGAGNGFVKFIVVFGHLFIHAFESFRHFVLGK